MTQPSTSPVVLQPPTASGLVFPIEGFDLTATVADRAELQRWLPHRDQMALLDRVIAVSDDGTCVLGIKHITDQEFWVTGHFPERPMFPGVLMIETGAQLAAYSFNFRRGDLNLAAFIRIENAVFRNAVEPGDDLYLLSKDVKVGRRRFTCDIQGVVRDQIAFEARIGGMTLGTMNPDGAAKAGRGESAASES